MAGLTFLAFLGLAGLLLFSSQNIEFDGEILPNLASPAWELQSGTGAPIPPGILDIVDGRTVYRHFAGTIWRIIDQTILAPLNAADGYSAEFCHANISNTKDVTQTGNYARGDAFQIFDGEYRVNVMFSPQGLRVQGLADYIFYSGGDFFTQDFHVYKFICQNGWYDFYIDGIKRNGAQMTIASTPGDKFITFGAGNSAGAVQGSANWDYVYVTFGGKIEANVNLDPDTLNLGSMGNSITAYIEVPAGHDVNDIDINSIKLAGTIPAESWPFAVGDNDLDGISDLMVKFERARVQAYIRETMGITSGSVTLTVSGELNGTEFEGADTIRVISKK
jgi:hypothetical protein